jgi:hypothetical protein
MRPEQQPASLSEGMMHAGLEYKEELLARKLGELTGV